MQKFSDHIEYTILSLTFGSLPWTSCVTFEGAFRVVESELKLWNQDQGIGYGRVSVFVGGLVCIVMP